MVNDDETYHSRFMGFFVEKYWSSHRVCFYTKKFSEVIFKFTKFTGTEERNSFAK